MGCDCSAMHERPRLPRRPAFNADVAPILQKNCLACHSSAAKMGGFVMESYDLLMKGGKDGAVIVPGKGEQSRLIQMLEGKSSAPHAFWH